MIPSNEETFSIDLFPGNIYAMVDGKLWTAPLYQDGTVDEEQWGEVIELIKFMNADRNEVGDKAGFVFPVLLCPLYSRQCSMRIRWCESLYMTKTIKQHRKSNEEM